MNKNINSKIKLAAMVYDPAMPPILVTEEEMYAIKYTFDDFLKDHPDITHPDYTEDEVIMNVLKTVINVVLGMTRGGRRDYV
jgi:hypothetical protein